MYPCPKCDVVDDLNNIKKHFKEKHLKRLGPLYVFHCKMCTYKGVYKNLIKHWKTAHNSVSPNQQPQNADNNAATVSDEHEVHHLSDIDNQSDVEMAVEDDNRTDSATPDDTSTPNYDRLTPTISELRDFCDSTWMLFAQSESTTMKAADEFADHLLLAVSAAMKVFEPFVDESIFLSTVDTVMNSLDFLKTGYRRRKAVEKDILFVKPEARVVDVHMQPTASIDNTRMVAVPHVVAKFSVRKTLEDVLSIPDVADTLIMASEFDTSTQSVHPFCGERTADLVKQLGTTNFIAIQAYIDDFSTANQLGSTSNTYNQCGCYFRFINLPAEYLSNVNFIFPAFLTFSSDAKADMQEVIRKCFVHELRALETEGITFKFKGALVTLPVVLHSFTADNLGFHQAMAYTVAWRGPNSCRMCIVDGSQLTNYQTLNELQQRSKELHIRSTCCFRE